MAEPKRSEQAGQLITNAIKLGGLTVVFWVPPGLADLDQTVRLGLAAFMMAGAQGLDQFLKAFFQTGERK